MFSLLPILLALLYGLCGAFVLSLITLLAVSPERKRGKRNLPWSPVVPAATGRNSRSQRRAFIWLALSLLLWQMTLFGETHTALPWLQLWLGRINFASVALAVYLAWRFVDSLQRSVSTPLPSPASVVSRPFHLAMRVETALLTLVTLLTPLVDEAETVVDGHPITRFGPLFPVYLLHVLGYLGAALVIAFRAGRRATNRQARGRLILIGWGIMATGGIALITNALLPYGFGDFRFGDVGTLSTVFFLLAVAYAVFVHGLFATEFVLRRTLVYGVLLAFVLGAYGSTIFLVTQYLTGGDRLTQFVVLLLAFSFDPLRRFLEEKTDQFLFEQNDRQARDRKHPDRSRLLRASVFPWQRS